jgi:DNA-binding NarL/FixJ family response regulator
MLADDHPLFRDSLRSLLGARGSDVVGEAMSRRQAVEHAKRLRPDVFLMDLVAVEAQGLSKMDQGIPADQ